MKTFLKWLKWAPAVALLLFGTYAYANYTLVQKDDGTFTIRDEKNGYDVFQISPNYGEGGTKEIVRLLNSSGLEVNRLSRWCGTTYLADVSAESTAYIASPVTGTIASLDVVLRGAITSADSIMHIMIGTTSVSGTMTIANSGSGAGVRTASAGWGSSAVSQGSVIHIGSGGESSTTAIADILLCIDTW